MIPLLACIQIQSVSHTFHYVASGPANSVSLAGTFNNWSNSSTPMKVGADGRTWTATLNLAPGSYQYKFVINGSQWIVDPVGKSVSDGNGNTNSLLALYPSDYSKPARKGDGVIATSQVKHLTEVPDLNWDRGNLTLSITTRPNDVRKVSVVVNGRTVPMKAVGADDITERYQAVIPWNRTTNLQYVFRLDDGQPKFLGSKGISDSDKTPQFAVSAKSFKPFVVPQWVEKSVIYQIFPDRFANGDKANDPVGTMPWDGKPTYSNMFGGDLAGVSQHVDYLRSLRIGAVYFNPIFESPVNHRYETTDYLKVDHELGTNAEFVQLSRKLKQSGMRTVLDGVFNHTATNFFAFQDVRDKGAGSKYTHWYWFNSFPVKIQENPNYVAWFNYPSLPKVNILNGATEKYFLSIPTFWQSKASVEGWRLDVGNEVPHEYWQAFRKVVKAKDPNAWILGENWGESTPWLQGNEWDSTMNYPFREAILSLVGKNGTAKPSEFFKKLMRTYSIYPPQVNRNLMNLLGSHDTARILTEVGGDRDLAKLAAILQFTWVGAPSIYYGDELGMEGGADPDNRRGMRWDLATSSNDMLRLYRKLVELRSTSAVLQSGDPVVLSQDDRTQTGVFGRQLGKQVALVAFNRSNTPQKIVTDLPAAFRAKRFINALTGTSITTSFGSRLSIQLAPKQADILMPQSGSTSHPRPARALSLTSVHRSTTK